MELGRCVKGFAGVTEENWVGNGFTFEVGAGNDVAIGIVNDVGGYNETSGGLLDDIADGAEVVGEGPEDSICGGVGEEFVLGLGRPEIMVRNGAVIDLDNGLVVFGNEDGFTVGCAVAIRIQNFANPNVVVIVGVFYDLNGRPFLRFGVKFLLSDGGEAISIIPFVQLAVRGVGFGNTVAFVVVRVSPVRIRRQLVIRAGCVLVAVGGEAVAVGVIRIGFVGDGCVGVVGGDELSEEVVIVRGVTVEGVEVFDDVVCGIVCV